jgi:hypothetical protein
MIVVQFQLFFFKLTSRSVLLHVGPTSSFGCTIFWKIADIERIYFLKLRLDDLKNMRQN